MSVHERMEEGDCEECEERRRRRRRRRNCHLVDLICVIEVRLNEESLRHDDVLYVVIDTESRGWGWAFEWQIYIFF